MIIEMREYTLEVGATVAFLSLYEAEGLKIQTAILGNMVGFFSTEIGMLNHVVHLWGYLDANEREDRRRKLASDVEWQAYVKKSSKFLLSQQNRILLPHFVDHYSPLCGIRR